MFWPLVKDTKKYEEFRDVDGNTYKKQAFHVKNFYTGNTYTQAWLDTPANGLSNFRVGQYSQLKDITESVV